MSACCSCAGRLLLLIAAPLQAPGTGAQGRQGRRPGRPDRARHGITDQDTDVSIHSDAEAAEEQAEALNAYERGTAALDAARQPRDMAAVSRAIAEGQYHLACAEALAAGRPRPDRRPTCFFDPRHGMSVSDVTGRPRTAARPAVPACFACADKVEQGIEPDMRTVETVPAPGRYVNSASPGVLGRLRLRRALFTGFLLGEVLAPRRSSATTIRRRRLGRCRRRRIRRRGLRRRRGDFGGGDFGGGDRGGVGGISAAGTSAAEAVRRRGLLAPQQLLSPPAIIPGRPQLTLATAGQRPVMPRIVRQVRHAVVVSAAGCRIDEQLGQRPAEVSSGTSHTESS